MVGVHLERDQRVVDRVLSGVESSRNYLTGPGSCSSDGNPSVVAEILDWISGDGFGETFDRLTYGQFGYASALHYRERFFLKALKG